jgi:hypothetical protein
VYSPKKTTSIIAINPNTCVCCMPAFAGALFVDAVGGALLPLVFLFMQRSTQVTMLRRPLQMA